MEQRPDAHCAPALQQHALARPVVKGAMLRPMHEVAEHGSTEGTTADAGGGGGGGDGEAVCSMHWNDGAAPAGVDAASIEQRPDTHWPEA